MNLRNAITGMALILVFSTSYAVSAQSGAVQPGTGSTSQNPQSRGPRAGGQNRDDLNLTAEQQAQLKSIRQREHDQLQALRNEALTEDQRRAKMQSIRQASRQQVLGILTPQQQQVINNNRHEGGGRGDRRRGPEGRRGPGGFQGIDALNLTADQKTQLKTIHENARTQIEAVRNDSTLNQEQKEAKLRSIHQNTKQQLSGILTPEQQQKMRDGHRGGPGRRGGQGRPDGGGGERRRGLLGTPGSKP